MRVLEFKFGGDFLVTELDTLSPGNGEVLVKVMASALDTSCKSIIDKAFTASFIHKLQEPLYLGYHYAGVVAAVGQDVEVLAVGSEVFGFLQYDPNQQQGAFAEFITVKSTDCGIKPSSVSYSTAAAASTEALTSLQALRDCGQLDDSGKSVLVVGAAGGVGSLGVGIAKALGAAHVTAVCSSKDIEKVTALGADKIIDRRKQDVTKLKNVHFDVIFDTPPALDLPLHLLKPNGSYVSTIPSLKAMLGKLAYTSCSSKRVEFVHAISKKEDLELIAKWIEEGRLKVVIDSTFNIKDMGKALHRQFGQKKGRVVIRVDGGWD